MKRVLTIFIILVIAAAASAQQKPSSAVSGGSLFFPRNFIWGYSQFDVAPPHNEPDPNLCAGNAGDFGGKDTPCNAFARYMLSGYVEVRPFARTQLRRLFFFGAPTFLFGKNLPHTLYTWSPAAIGWSVPGEPELNSGEASNCASPSTSYSNASAPAIASLGQPTLD